MFPKAFLIVARYRDLARLQLEALQSASIENKGVTIREHTCSLQFPFGDDVSVLHPLRSSVGVSALRGTEAQPV